MNAPEFKAAAKKVMMDHLISKGYPNLSQDQIMAELKPMWVKLEEAKLVPNGMRFKLFCDIARQKALEAEFAHITGFGGHKP